jgi:hypothetical protein
MFLSGKISGVTELDEKHPGFSGKKAGKFPGFDRENLREKTVLLYACTEWSNYPIMYSFKAISCTFNFRYW